MSLWSKFVRARPWLRGYSAHYFPGARHWLKRYTGLAFFEKTDQPQWLIAARHPRTSITWLWTLCWWPPRTTGNRWCARRSVHNCGSQNQISVPFLGTLSLNTQHRMPWRKGAFAEFEGETLQ